MPTGQSDGGNSLIEVSSPQPCQESLIVTAADARIPLPLFPILTTECCHIQLYTGSGDLNSGPHVCAKYFTH